MRLIKLTWKHSNSFRYQIPSTIRQLFKNWFISSSTQPSGSRFLMLFTIISGWAYQTASKTPYPLYALSRIDGWRSSLYWWSHDNLAKVYYPKLHRWNCSYKISVSSPFRFCWTTLSRNNETPNNVTPPTYFSLPTSLGKRKKAKKTLAKGQQNRINYI